MFTENHAPVRVRVETTVDLSPAVALDILNVAINGGCERWPNVSDKVQHETTPFYVGATFSRKDNHSARMTVTSEEVATAIQMILSDDYSESARTKRRLLRILANDDASEVDLETASSIVRAAMASVKNP